MGEKLVVNPSFEICCPKCDTVNTIKMLEEIKCEKCDTSFSGKKFFGKISCSTISKLLLGATLGVGGTIYSEVKMVNNFSEKENQKIERRIPIPAENTYKYVKSCIAMYSESGLYTKKIRDNCFCAVEELSKYYDIRWAKIHEYTISDYYDKCSTQ